MKQIFHTLGQPATAPKTLVQVMPFHRIRDDSTSECPLNEGRLIPNPCAMFQGITGS